MADDREVFLDTGYVYALVNTRDRWHDAAVAWESRLAREQRRILTTELVLIEIADGLAAVKYRVHAAKVISALQESELVEIVPASSSLFRAGLTLYEQRSDKDWGLTDCTSFATMTQRGLSDALTTDDHFRQAGFRMLLEDI